MPCMPVGPREGLNALYGSIVGGLMLHLNLKEVDSIIQTNDLWVTWRQLQQLHQGNPPLVIYL